jgi:hypothetical protein
MELANKKMRTDSDSNNFFVDNSSIITSSINTDSDYLENSGKTQEF